MGNKRLILRLSSLGDVILASAALEVFPSGEKVDWIVATEFAEVLYNHPKIGQLFVFDRKAGLRAWLRLCKKLWDADYHEVFDLHRTLRSRLMFFSFLFWSFKKRRAMPFWKTVSKERFRLYSYFFFKAGWPTSLRPSPWVRRFTQRVGGSGNERPNLKHLLQGGDLPPELHSLLQKKQKYFCVMPSSRWKGKKWPVDSYFQTLSQLADVPVILGTDYDQESKELVRKLEMSGVSHISGVGRWSLKQTALILSHSAGYLGGDTGLAHLAEAVGVSASVIFGPSSSDMGFGPWKKESRSIEIPLVCRPCSKDGRFCYRLTKKYACLKNLSPQIVIETLKC